MDHDRFDDLTRTLAAGISRRGVLKLSGGVLTSGLAAVLGRRRAAQAQPGGECAAFCNALFPAGPARGACKRQAARGEGICVACGADVEKACVAADGTTSCPDLLTDAANCGICGVACGAGETCRGGTCCADALCGGACCDARQDVCLLNQSCAETCLPKNCTWPDTCPDDTCSANCICSHDVEGVGHCIPLNTFCADVSQACSSTADCPRGEQCISTGCCPEGQTCLGCVPLCPSA